jgi:predicted metal-binding membrane protein
LIERSPLESLLARDRAIVIAALTLMCAFAWTYILEGAGLGMSAWGMTEFALFPHRSLPEMAGMAGMPMGPSEVRWSADYGALMIAMWWTMMIAMMTPSAAPAILLYARVARHAATPDSAPSRLAGTGAFAAGYLLGWLAFSVAAAAVYWLLLWAGSISTAMMNLQSRWLSAGLLILTGVYQLSHLKTACLSHCRSPALFLSRHWRPGLPGALRLGTLHGAYCVGCCWALMALLFVGGVMNLAWIAALSLMVLAEKLFPSGRWVGHAMGVLLIVWGLATLVI